MGPIGIGPTMTMPNIEIVGGILLGVSAIGFILLETLDKALQSWRAEESHCDARNRHGGLVLPELEREQDSLAIGHAGEPDNGAHPVLDARRVAALPEPPGAGR
jgi:hypothetical protein